MKNKLFLVVAFLISVNVLQLNAQDESKTAAYVKGGLKVGFGTLLTAWGIACFYQRSVLTTAEVNAANDWDKFLKDMPSATVREIIQKHGQKKYLKNVPIAKRSTIIAGFIFLVPGAGLLFSGVKQIHRARTAE